MSKVINLCRTCKCCPSIKEDRNKKIMYIVDGEQKIPFTEEQVANLTKYLNKRG